MRPSRPAKTSARKTPAKFTSLLSARGPSKSFAQKFLKAHGFREPSRALAAIHRLPADPVQRRSLRRIFKRVMQACATSADPDRALVNFGRLVDALPNANMFYHYLNAAPDRIELLVRVFAHSQALADTLARNARYFHFLIAPETLQKPREKAWLAAELTRLLLPLRVAEHKYDAIRQFRRRETLRIGARDLTGLATVEETTLELSNLADVCLQAVFEIALETLCAKYQVGQWHGHPARESGGAGPLDLTGRMPVPLNLRFAVIGMGKLGGQELNYSSDVDVIFVYDEEGELTPRLSRHEFFTKLAEEIIRVVAAHSEEGNIFRIDLRLRPEGSSGPLVSSLDSCEHYYAQWGETWERMALVKARPVAGDAALGAEFVEMVQPFVYARHATLRIVQEMAAIKDRIEREIVHDDRLTRHVKLGVGGIREIEFIVQSFQVLRGARIVALRERSTLRALPLLVKRKLLGVEDAGKLANAYRFLRNVEHRLQMEMELQTHTIPDEEQALVRLARSLGFHTVKKFFEVQNAHTAAVRAIYEAVLANATQRVAAGPEKLLAPDQLAPALAKAGFADVPGAEKTVHGLLHGPGFVLVSQRTKELFARIFPTVLDVAASLADPDAALARFDKFVTRYGSRGLLYETFASNSRLIEMLMRLGDASRFLSDTLTLQPELFDELCRGATFNEPKSRDRMLQELVETAVLGTGGAEAMAPMDVARRWKRAELLRIGIEDVLGLVDVEQVHHEITSLAEVCLQFVLDQARLESGKRLGKLPFAIIGMGKLGGRELGYGADLDILFVGGHDASDQPDACQLAVAMTTHMKAQTGAGTLFQLDPRLRPDGEKGSLASGLEAHRDYYRQRAQLWEKQALTRARFVAGDIEFGHHFIAMVHEIIYAQPITADDIQEIRRMRHRVETERGDQKHADLEFKTGPGGLADVEFLVQALQLLHGHEHQQLRTAHTLAALNRLTALGIVDDTASYRLRRGCLFLRRIESVLRRAENTSVSRIPTDPREQTLLAKRLGFPDAATFLQTYRQTTTTLRELYESVLSACSRRPS